MPKMYGRFVCGDCAKLEWAREKLDTLVWNLDTALSITPEDFDAFQNPPWNAENFQSSVNRFESWKTGVLTMFISIKLSGMCVLCHHLQAMILTFIGVISRRAKLVGSGFQIPMGFPNWPLCTYLCCTLLRTFGLRMDRIIPTCSSATELVLLSRAYFSTKLSFADERID